MRLPSAAPATSPPGGGPLHVAIIGSGIVGVAVAHALLDRQHQVTLIDPHGPAERGASRGNAGMIAHADILPIASPKAWAHLPRWLLDPLGPLAIRPAYLPGLLPWLVRFVAASRPGRVEAGTRALSALNGLALPAWERQLAVLGLSGHLRRRGFLSVWSDAGAFAAARPLLERQRGLGLAVETLDAGAVRALEPALGPRAVAGALYPGVAHVSDPLALTLDLARTARERQARVVADAARAIEPEADGVSVRLEGGGALRADAVVLAAGAWSRPLAAALGERVPLDTERGYNVTLSPGALGLSRPVCYEGEGFVTSTLDVGDRVGGAVEFGGLRAPPDWRRVDAILARLRRWLPEADLAGGERWMGFRPSLPDSLPVIGRSAGCARVVHAFGHGHLGLTQAAATGALVAALLAGEAPAVDLAPFGAGRFG